MIAVCTASTSRALADHQKGRFAGIDQEYPITMGRSYLMAGFGIWETTLYILVRDDNGLPSWCPAGLFEIAVQSVPSGWKFTLYDGISASGTDLWTKWVARCGYDELVRDAHHSDLLQERDPDAVEVFERELRRLERE